MMINVVWATTLYSLLPLPLFIWQTDDRDKDLRNSAYICSCPPVSVNLNSIQLTSSWVNPIRLSLRAWENNIARVLRVKSNTLTCCRSCYSFSLSALFLSLCPPLALLLQTSARSSSPHPPWSSGSGRTSRRSSWNSLGRAPSLKRQKRQSGERRSLLSGEGGSSSEEGEGGGEGGLMEDDDASLARTDSMSQSQRGPRHRRMESVETRSSMDLPPDALLQVDSLHSSVSALH